MGSDLLFLSVFHQINIFRSFKCNPTSAEVTEPRMWISVTITSYNHLNKHLSKHTKPIKGFWMSNLLISYQATPLDSHLYIIHSPLRLSHHLFIASRTCDHFPVKPCHHLGKNQSSSQAMSEDRKFGRRINRISSTHRFCYGMTSALCRMGT